MGILLLAAICLTLFFLCKRRKAKTVVVKEEINDLYGDDDYYANPDAIVEMVDHNDYYAVNYDYETDTTETKDMNSEYGC